MNIKVYSIAKKERTLYDPLYKELIKMSTRFANIEDVELFPKEVAKAHTISPQAAQEAYTQVLMPYVSKSYSVVLHPEGKALDSMEFSKLLSDRMSLHFFIGGAYGFSDAFVSSCDRKISLSDLTMSHKIAKAVLYEQIYRGFSILSGHPYHK